MDAGCFYTLSVYVGSGVHGSGGGGVRGSGGGVRMRVCSCRRARRTERAEASGVRTRWARILVGGAALAARL